MKNTDEEYMKWCADCRQWYTAAIEYLKIPHDCKGEK